MVADNQNQAVPFRPWRKNPRTGRNGVFKQLKIHLGKNPYCLEASVYKELPLVVTTYHCNREGSADLATLLNVHPFPGPGVRSMGGYPTHPFVRTMCRQVLEYFKKHTTSSGAKWP